MTTSGTDNFFLDNSDIVLEAFDRIGIRPTSLTRQHMISATRSVNLALQTWGNRGVNLWSVDLQSIPLIQGTATYDIPSDTVSILDAYRRTFNNNASPPTYIDQYMMPISRTEYASYADKTNQSPPTVYWFDRLSPTGTVTLWEVPDGGGPYAFNYYRMKRVQDAATGMGQTADIPYLFMDALCADIANRLARKYAPNLVQMLALEAKAAWDEAAVENREYVDIKIMPELSGYWNV